jgi:hypothetical protein
MDKLIKKVVDQLGLDEEITRKALGALLIFLKSHVGEDFDFSEILTKLEGAEALIKSAEEEPLPEDNNARGAQGGSTFLSLIVMVLKSPLMAPILAILKQFLGVFMPSVLPMLESAGDGAELVDLLNKLGLSTDQGKSMVNMLVEFMRGKLGPEVVDKLEDQIPAVKAFLASTKKDE